MRKVKIKNLVIFLLCFVLLALFEPFGDASAYAAINRSISSESDKVARIDDDGTLKFVLTAQAASSGTRWKTVGLYVTSDPTGRNGKESTKAKDCVFFDKLPKGCSKSDRVRGDTVITTFTISKEVFNRMCDKAGVNLKHCRRMVARYISRVCCRDTRSEKADQSATLPNAAILIGRWRTHVTPEK